MKRTGKELCHCDVCSEGSTWCRQNVVSTPTKDTKKVEVLITRIIIIVTETLSIDNY
jgi:hypothetical protein